MYGKLNKKIGVGGFEYKKFGSVSDVFLGAALATNNNNIYFSPHISSQILKLNPDTDTYSQFGTVTGNYAGAVAYNGKIYCFPYDNTNVLIINTNTDTLSTTAAFTSRRYYNGVLASDGNIYAMPTLGGDIMKINTSTDVVSFPKNGITDLSSIGTVLGTDGDIYACPHTSNVIYKYNYTTNALSTISLGASYTAMTIGGIIGNDNDIYYASYNYNQILKLASGVLSSFGTISSDVSKYLSCFQKKGEAKIYFTPFNSESLIEIDTISQDIRNYLSIAGVSKYGGSCMSRKGDIYLIPMNETSILKIKGKPLSATDYTINLSGFETSNYNKLFNHL